MNAMPAQPLDALQQAPPARCDMTQPDGRFP
jgi:hypothetical protein